HSGPQASLSQSCGIGRKTFKWSPEKRGPSLGTESTSVLILDFRASGTVRNTCLWFKPPSPSLAQGWGSWFALLRLML
uniref:Uncharacterized protein n=1 Tax=Sus scrofa TaxID=9823 RepID=A0A8D1P9Q8_PIG